MMEQPTKYKTLILFVDAFAYDYLAQRPFMPGFWQAALPLESLLGYSCSIVPALWSGKYPDQLGAWNEFFYQPRQPYRLPRLLERAPHPYLGNFLRMVLYHYSSRAGWYPQYLPAIPGSVDHLFTRGVVHYSEFPPIPLGDSGLDARLKRAGQQYRFWFTARDFRAGRALQELRETIDQADVFIYSTASIDEAGHLCGPDPQKFDAEFRELETYIAEANELMGQRGWPQIVVLSDHGMTAIRNKFDLFEWLEPWKLGKDYIAFLDSTMARFWDKGKVPLHRVMERVRESRMGHWLDSSERDRYGLNFSDNRYGDEIFLLDPGCVLHPSFMDAPYIPFLPERYVAVHGYAPDEPSTRAIFLYHGAAPLPFEPKKVTDVIEILAHLTCSAEPVKQL